MPEDYISMIKKRYGNLQESSGREESKAEPVTLDGVLAKKKATEASLFEVSEIERLRIESETKLKTARVIAGEGSTGGEKKHKYSVVEGRVIVDPDGELDLNEALKLAADERATLATQNKPQGFLQQLDNLLEGKLADRIAGIIAGGSEGKPPSEDEFIDKIKYKDKVMDALGIKDTGLGRESLARGEGIRADLLRILLEDERERLRIAKEHELEMAKIKKTPEEDEGEAIFGTLIRESAHEIGRKSSKPASTKPPKTQYWANCPHCGERVEFKEKPAGEMTCPHCQKKMRPKG